MRKSILKKVAVSASILFLLCVLTLGTHIYLVKHKSNKGSQLAIGRVDFNQALEPAQGQQFRDFAASLVGVQNAFCNHKEGTLVFMYFPAKQNAEEIYQKIKFYSQLPAKRYQPAINSMGGTCTAGFGENSATSKAISYISKTILSE